MSSFTWQPSSPPVLFTWSAHSWYPRLNACPSAEKSPDSDSDAPMSIVLPLPLTHPAWLPAVAPPVAAAAAASTTAAGPAFHHLTALNLLSRRRLTDPLAPAGGQTFRSADPMQVPGGRDPRRCRRSRARAS